MHTFTHTYSVLPISKEAYEEIRRKLEAAGYDSQFHDDRIDMHGLAITIEKLPTPKIREEN